MPLVLTPSYDERTKDQIEDHIAAVRARRMVHVVEYQMGVQTKLEHESDKIQARIAREYEKLKKRLEKQEEAEDKVIESITVLEALRQELGLTVDMIELHQVPTERED